MLLQVNATPPADAPCVDPPLDEMGSQRLINVNPLLRAENDTRVPTLALVDFLRKSSAALGFGRGVAKTRPQHPAQLNVPHSAVSGY